MGAIQLMGMTHFPPFVTEDHNMAWIMERMLMDPGIPDDVKDPAGWPEEMQAEWGDDRGATAASRHRADLINGFDRIRSQLEAFEPDVILIWGDDQYENFREDLIPPYAILAYSDREVRPYDTYVYQAFPTYWHESPDLTITVKGRPDIARWLTERLIDDGFDVAYAYEPLHDRQLPHAFLNTLLFIDHQRIGFPWPVICMPINCYGRRVISAKGGVRPFGEEMVLDPPSPPPARLMDLGAATFRSLLASPWRVAIVASASWSHSFLTDHTWRMRPDTAADRRLYDAMVAGDFTMWAKLTTADVEHAGQQEILNWSALLGAARELGMAPSWSVLIDTWVLNSNKVFAIWEPTP
ncbi:MAG TPA: hypothetical protein VHB02_17580 [Acidimicrobiales bacterium]|nr:hypothetical protein [Acidimicrobiales bacterium]